eukprot:GDKJ01050860.1.p1 GENE.GDKJ01050860.1~~GDKJ01050860.1.p1  ORF type:complete len:293 (-),score=93.02 GDKJ01050860.1:46-924(-)
MLLLSEQEKVSLSSLLSRAKQSQSVVSAKTGNSIWLNSKLNAFLDIVKEETSKHRSVVVFSQWVPILHHAAKAVDELLNLEARVFDGSLCMKKRNDVLEWFRGAATNAKNAKASAAFSASTPNSFFVRKSTAEDSIPQPLLSGGISSEKRRADKGVVLFVSLKAGGTGLNLVEASVCILMDPWWNPAVEDQAIQRIFRIGQRDSVNVYRLITEGTVEERMLELHQKKRKDSKDIARADQDESGLGSEEDLVVGEEGEEEESKHGAAGGKMSMEDLKQLFKPYKQSSNLEEGS